jgi:splicing factor U2AF subunit
MLGNPGFPGAPGTMMTGTNAIGGPVRQSKRLYVGNVGPEATDQNMADFFNQKMREHKFAVDLPGEPVANIQVNHDKSYAFVEFRIPEEATSAMAFDGIIYQGIPLKIRRPKDYVGPEGPLGTLYVPGVVGTTVADTPNKVYIGGLPTYLQDEQVMELLKSFGELKSFNLVKEGGGQTGVSKVSADFRFVSAPRTMLMALFSFHSGFRLLRVRG